MRGAEGVPGGGNGLKVTSALAMTPPRAFDTRPLTATAWADARAGTKNIAKVVMTKRNLTIDNTSDYRNG